jgi:hypothetical protein
MFVFVVGFSGLAKLVRKLWFAETRKKKAHILDSLFTRK